MKKVLACILFMAAQLSCAEHSNHGVVSVPSKHSVVETADKLESLLKNKGFTVFARVKHSEAAAKQGVELRPTELVIFGNPKVGSHIMKCQQLAAIDLPQKALIWQDEQGQVQFSYNDVAYLVKRHDIDGCEEVLGKVKGALAKFAEVVTK